MEIRKVNIKEKFGLINEFWSPHNVGELNENYVKLAKIKGEFIWHQHENEDEMFLVIKGNFDMHIKLNCDDENLEVGEKNCEKNRLGIPDESAKDKNTKSEVKGIENGGEEVIIEKIINIKEGEFIVIPKGVIHKPVAVEEVHILLIEPKTTLNTGDKNDSELTKNILKYI